MKDEIIKILSKKIKHAIVKDLMNSYEKMKDEFIKGNYEEAQSKSGKFVENVFRSLHFIRTNQPLKEIKPGQMREISKKLMDANGTIHSESIRILIPQIAQAMIYEPRSKMGSVHVKPVEPDFIDAKLTVDAADWIIAELLRQYDTRDTEKVNSLINNVVKEYIPIFQKVGNEIFVDANVKCDEEILLRLYNSSKGLNRMELGQVMKNNFSPSAITKQLKKLHRTKQIFFTENKKYVISESARKKTSKKIVELSLRGSS